jgi:hypothetical protein
MLLRILSPYFVSGVIVGVRAAPIIHYMQSWSIEQILLYCKRKGWQCQKIS